MLTEGGKLRALLEYIHKSTGKKSAMRLPPNGIDGIENNEYPRLFKKLEELSWIEGRVIQGHFSNDMAPLFFLKATTDGVSVLEQNISIDALIKASITQTPNSQNIHISSIINPQNVVAGNNNTVYQQASSAEELGQHLQALAQLIKQLQATPKEKEEAQSLFRKILESPLLAALAPTVVGAILASL